MVAVLANELHQIAYRDDVCAHLTIDGACPRGPREVLLAEPMAARLGLAVGDTVALRGRTEIPPVPMTVVGRYRATDPNDPYWGIQPRAASAWPTSASSRRWRRSPHCAPTSSCSRST
jgi:hypothetical protein